MKRPRQPWEDERDTEIALRYGIPNVLREFDAEIRRFGQRVGEAMLEMRRMFQSAAAKR